MLRVTSALSRFGATAVLVVATSIISAATEWHGDDLESEAVTASITETAVDSGVVANTDIERTPAPRIVLAAADAIVGIASFYDDPQQTASGEQYDPNAFTAAAQLEIRGRFGGIRFGRLYEPAYGLGEFGGKKIIVRFNDVGPLRPGRKFDLSQAAMAHFDSTLDQGLLPDFQMTPLPLGRSYPEGPVTDQQLADLGIEHDIADVCAVILADPAPAPAARPIQTSFKVASWSKAKSRLTLRAKAKAKALAKARDKAKTRLARSITPAKHAANRMSDKRRPGVIKKLRLASKATHTR